jgi:integrase
MARNLYRLSARQVSSIKSQAKSFRLADGGGLYLYVRVSGSRNWEFRYTRPSDRKQTFIGIGSFPDITLAEARDRAKNYRKILSDGYDPQLANQLAKHQILGEIHNTFQHVAELWMESVSNRLAPKTIIGNRRKLEKYAYPKLASLPVTEISAPIVIDALRPVEEAGYLETVKRTAELVSRVMTYACNHGLIQANPIVGVKDVFKKPIRQNLASLSPEEISELLHSVATANIHAITRCLIEFQLHTLTRPNEAAGACWNEIDLQRKLWIIPDSRMKMRTEHRIPLSIPALKILDAIRPMTGHRQYIFTSPRDPNKSIDSETVNKALGKMGFKNRTTGHGLRSLASTTLNESGFAPHVIEAALAHKVANPIAAAYNHATYLDLRREMMDWWSEYIERASVGSLSVTGSNNRLMRIPRDI